MAAVAARSKRRHSSFAVFIFLSARARARARVDRRPKRLGALGSPLRVLNERGTLQSSRRRWRSSSQTSRARFLCLVFRVAQS